MSAWRQGVTWLVLLATVVAQSNLPAFVGHAQTLGSPPPAEALGRLFDALEAAAQDLPRDTFDLQAALMQSDLTPAGLLAWVRDNTYLVPYRGALRGPTGVLMDRVGNSLDRALLLQGLLQLLGYDTRLARAQLSETQAQEVLRRARPIPDAGARPDAAGANSSGDLGRYAAAFGLDPAQLEQALEQVTQQQVALRGELQARVEAQTAFLARALGSPAGDPAAERAEQLDALRDHWWVEVLENGVWTGLDPTLPDAAPGQALAAAAETLSAAKLEDLPSDLLHTLQIRVVLECAVNGGLQETTLVESPVLVPANLLGQYLAVTHVPVKMPQALGSRDAAAIQDLVLKQDLWFPAITIGGQSLYDKSFTTGCEIAPARPPWLGEAVTGALEEATNLFDTLGGEVSEASPEERVTAEFIEYTVHVPGQGDEVVRRALFDRIGPATRAAGAPAMEEAMEDADAARLAWRLALFGETEILPLASQPSPAYVTALLARRLLAQRDALLGAARASTQAELEAVVDRAAENAPLPSALYALALARRELLRDSHLYQGKVNVINRHSWMQPSGANLQGATLLQGFDFVLSSLSALPGGQSSFAARLRQGIIDTNAETLLEALMCQGIAGEAPCQSRGNAADALALSPRPEAWAVIRSEAELGARGHDWPADVQARVRQEIAAGYAVVAPVALESSDPWGASWWRVDAATGETLGVNLLGWGPSAAEYALIVNFIGFGFCEVGTVLGGTPVGGTVLCVFGFATGTGAILATGVNAAGILGIVAALLYGIGGLGSPHLP